MLQSFTTNRPLPPIPSNDRILYSPKPLEQRRSYPQSVKSSSPPPPPTEPPPPLPSLSILPGSPPGTSTIQPLRPTSHFVHGSHKPRPRVPRMGTGVPILPTMVSAPLSTQPGGSELLQTGKINSCQNEVKLNNFSLKHDASKKGSSINDPINRDLTNNAKSGLERKLSSTFQILLSSARSGSSIVSSDLKKFIKRYSYPKGRLTPISERTNHSSNQSERSRSASSSVSLSEASDRTATTNLSLTWPLSRSQTDVSSKIYRSFYRPWATKSESDSVDRVDQNHSTGDIPPFVAVTETEKEQTVSKHDAAKDNRVTDDWARESGSDELWKHLKMIRVINLTSKRWKIKRRPDGTRYLVYRKRQEGSCCHHSQSLSCNESHLPAAVSEGLETQKPQTSTTVKPDIWYPSPHNSSPDHHQRKVVKPRLSCHDFPSSNLQTQMDQSTRHIEKHHKRFSRSMGKSMGTSVCETGESQVNMDGQILSNTEDCRPSRASSQINRAAFHKTHSPQAQSLKNSRCRGHDRRHNSVDLVGSPNCVQCGPLRSINGRSTDSTKFVTMLVV